MRRVEPLVERQRGEVIGLHARIFGAAKAERFRDRFERLYVDNPYRRAGHVTNFVLTSDGAVVGHLGAVPVEVRVGAERLPASWICDYMVDEAHRFGPELAALRASASDSSDLPIGYGMPDHVARSYVKLGWSRLAVGPFLVKCLRWRGVAAVLRGDAGRRGLERARTVWQSAARLPRFARQRLRRPAVAPAGSAGVGLGRGFDESFDRLWEEVVAGHPVAVERSRRYLGWRHPLGGDHGARLVVLGEAEAPRGFAVVEKVRWRGLEVGLVSELIAARDGGADARRLLAFVETLLRREGVDAIVTEGFPAPLRAAFRAEGFEPVGAAANATFLDRSRRCPPLLVGDVENWLLTPADSDRGLGYPRAAWRRE